MLRPNGGSAQLDADFLAALITKGRRSVRGKESVEGGAAGSVPNELLPSDAGQYLKACNSTLLQHFHGSVATRDYRIFVDRIVCGRTCLLNIFAELAMILLHACRLW